MTIKTQREQKKSLYYVNMYMYRETSDKQRAASRASYRKNSDKRRASSRRSSLIRYWKDPETKRASSCAHLQGTVVICDSNDYRSEQSRRLSPTQLTHMYVYMYMYVVLCDKMWLHCLPYRKHCLVTPGMHLQSQLLYTCMYSTDHIQRAIDLCVTSNQHACDVVGTRGKLACVVTHECWWNSKVIHCTVQRNIYWETNTTTGEYEHARQFFSDAMPFYLSCLTPPAVTLLFHFLFRSSCRSLNVFALFTHCLRCQSSSSLANRAPPAIHCASLLS